MNCEVIMPRDVFDAVPEIAEAAMQAAFGKIAERLEELGYPVTGDVTPEETLQLEEAFARYVRMMSLNNPEIGGMNT